MSLNFRLASKMTRAYPPEFGDHVSEIVRSRKDAFWLHLTWVYLNKFCLRASWCRYELYLPAKVPVDGPLQPLDLDMRLSDWELFRDHCLQNRGMNRGAITDLWHDAAKLHRSSSCHTFSKGLHGIGKAYFSVESSPVTVCFLFPGFKSLLAGCFSEPRNHEVCFYLALCAFGWGPP